MQERFLHFIWQYQYFKRENLQTTEGEPVKVMQPGVYNRQDSGPDFKGARLQIGGLDWHGDVEIHLRSSDWERHRHQHDPAYNSVILHLVWEDDGAIQRQDGTPVPQLILQHRVEASLQLQYGKLMQSPYSIPCAPQFDQADTLSKISMLDKALLQRLRRKAAIVLDWVNKADGDWETAAYHLLFQNFGFKKNNAPFLSLAQRLPLKILQKHANEPLQQEALLFGMAGFLEGVSVPDHPYLQKLLQEWRFLGHKYELSGKALQRHEWQFLRMRPANFPTVRLAQLAAILQAQHHLFSLFRDESSIEKLISLLRKPQSSYWKQHYDIGKPAKAKMPPLGLSSAQNLLINTAAPLLAAYGVHTDNESWIEKAMDMLQNLPAESNRIIDEWKALDLKAQHAFDSQAMLELYNEFCQPKKCLECTIGLQLLKRQEA